MSHVCRFVANLIPFFSDFQNIIGSVCAVRPVRGEQIWTIIQHYGSTHLGLPPRPVRGEHTHTQRPVLRVVSCGPTIDLTQRSMPQPQGPIALSRDTYATRSPCSKCRRSSRILALITSDGHHLKVPIIFGWPAAFYLAAHAKRAEAAGRGPGAMARELQFGTPAAVATR